MRRKGIFTAFLLISFIAIPSFPQTAPSRHEQLAAHTRLAQQYLAERRPDLALPELRAVIALDPNNVAARGNLGVLLFFRGDYAGAASQLRAALQLKPDLWKLQALLGLSEQRLGKQSESRADLETAFPHLREEKFKIEVGNALIDSYTSTGDLDNAATVASALLKLEPTNAQLLYTAYRLYSGLADQTVLTTAMTAPDSAEMHEMMARVSAREGDSKGAIANYREAIRLDANLPGLHFDLAELLNSTGTVDDQRAAVAEYKAALALNPSDEKSLSELGSIAAQTGDTKAALDYYSRAVELQPDDPAALAGLAKVYIAMQQPEKAMPLLEHAVELDPTGAAAHFRLSTLYRHQGRTADAKKQLDEYLKYKKMREQLSAIFKKMRMPQAKDAAGDSDAVR
jgi:tetratricopeptide (TPR) repeat protein